jgi:hypothetical protein
MSAFAFVPRKVAIIEASPDTGATSSAKTDQTASAVAKGKTRELPPVEVSHPESAAKPQVSDEDLTSFSFYPSQSTGCGPTPICGETSSGAAGNDGCALSLPSDTAREFDRV